VADLVGCHSVCTEYRRELHYYVKVKMIMGGGGRGLLPSSAEVKNGGAKTALLH
jgi:hypothetical protein